MKTIKCSCTGTMWLKCSLLPFPSTTGLGDIKPPVTAALTVSANKGFAEAPGARALAESTAPKAGLWARAM